MFKRILISLAFACVMVLPFSVNALSLSNYETTNFKETLDLEEIDYEFKSYKEGKNKINIYMFRGQGCYYCRNFLSFLNSIADDYGKYFNLVAFEVWNDSNNNQLLYEVADFLGEEAGGVPYIIIGDKVFPGYTSSFGYSSD